MDFFDAARTRRSVRSYSDKKIDRTHLESCVAAARIAPSACNAQPWKFVVIDEEPVLSEVKNRVFSGAYSMNSFARKAAAFIAVFSEKRSLFPVAGGMIRRTDLTSIDIGLACGNLVLAAAGLGIGSCILGWFNEKELKKILGAPNLSRIQLLISLGYPSEPECPPRNLRPPSDVIMFNKF